MRLRTIGLAALVLAIVGTAAFFIWRSTWMRDVDLTPREAFTSGSIGTELVPKKVFDVLPELFPDQFQPAGAGAGDWVDQFGFIRREEADSSYGLPVGFEAARFNVCRWISADNRADLDQFVTAKFGDIARDLDGDVVFLASDGFSLNYEAERWPAIKFAHVKEYHAVKAA